MKSLKLGDTIWADGYKATVYSLPNLDGDMQIILDEGLWTETIYDCSIHDITLDNDGEWELTTEFVPSIKLENAACIFEPLSRASFIILSASQLPT